MKSALNRKKTVSTKSEIPPLGKTDELRLLVLAHNHPDIFPGGAEGCAYNLFRYFKSKEGIKAAFIAATDSGRSTVYYGTALTAYNGRDDEMLLQAGAFDYFTQSLQSPQPLTEELAQYLLETQPDIIHIHHTLRIGIEVLAVIKQTLPDAKIVYTLHDFIPICHRDGQMLRSDGNLCTSSGADNCRSKCFPEITAARFKMREQLIRSYFDRVDAFVSPSEFLAQRFIDWGLPEEKIYVINNGVADLSTSILSEPRRKLGKKEPRNRFAYFGQITPYKGVTLLCEAAQILHSGYSDGDTDKAKSPSIKIDIYGNVKEQTKEFQQEFMQALESAGGAVTWHGSYRPDEVAQLMTASDWVVVPSIWWENAPLVIDEAFSCKRPVICADIGGMAEKVEHRKNGLHFCHGNAESLAATMREAAANPDMWYRMVKDIKSPPAIGDSAAKHEELYRKLQQS